MHPDHRQCIEFTVFEEGAADAFLFLWFHRCELGISIHRFAAVLYAVELFIGLCHLWDEGREDVFDRIASVHGWGDVMPLLKRHHQITYIGDDAFEAFAEIGEALGEFFDHPFLEAHVVR